VNIYDQPPTRPTAPEHRQCRKYRPCPRLAASEYLRDTAKGSQLTVVLKRVQTVNVQDSKFRRTFALQFATAQDAPGGVIKWRKVQIKSL